MAYVVPPTFADTNALSASQLNVLSSDIEYLNGITGGPQIAAPAMVAATTTVWTLFFRYLHRYIHFGWTRPDGTPTADDQLQLEIYNRAGDAWWTIIKDRSSSGTSEDIVCDLLFDVGSEFRYFDVGEAGELTTNQTGDDSAPLLNTFLTVGDFVQLRVTFTKDSDASIIIPYVINADGVTL